MWHDVLHSANIDLMLPKQGLDETPLTYVDTPDGLKRLAEALSDAREVAIDLEAHSYRC